MYEELDFRAYRVLRQTEGWTLRRWLATLRGVRSWALWSPRDPKPLLLKLVALVRSSVGRR